MSASKMRVFCMNKRKLEVVIQKIEGNFKNCRSRIW